MVTKRLGPEIREPPETLTLEVAQFIMTSGVPSSSSERHPGRDVPG